MRKQTKVAVVVSAAALLAMGASMTSFAKGWTLEDNEWVWLDSEGERVYGEWKKSVDGNYYWLDEETGVMATDRLVGEDDKDTYYVKNDGTRVISDWVAIENDDYAEVNGVEVDTLWYYFGSNGKAVKGTSEKPRKKDINGHTYFFDENGRMMSGVVEYGDKDVYYCGTEDQGYAYKGWQYLETEAMNLGDSEYEEEGWFYFKSGKLVYADDTKGEEFEVSYIDGKYYRFDINGVMTTGWENAGIASLPSGVATAPKSYANSDGAMSNGWVKVTKDDESNWYYMVTVKADDDSYKAVPFNAGGDAYRAKSIGGEVYAFDTNGKMLTGLQELDGTDGTLASKENKDYDSVTGKYLAKVSTSSRRMAPKRALWKLEELLLLMMMKSTITTLPTMVRL